MGKPAGADRRVAVRCLSSQDAPCHFASIDRIECRWAHVRDISRTGISLSLEEPFEVGQQLAIELPSKTPAASSVAAKVSHIMREADGWIIGCAFERPLTDAEFHTLV